MCKAESKPAAQTAVVVNQLESTSIDFHGPTMVQSILVTLAILLVLFLLFVCCRHYGCCSIAELAARRYDIGRWATGGNQPVQQPAIQQPAIQQPAVIYHQPVVPMAPAPVHQGVQQPPPVQREQNMAFPPRD